MKPKRPKPDPPGLYPAARFSRGLACIGIGAVILRAIYLLELRGDALAAVPIGDGWQYDAWAQGIARGEWLGNQAFYQTPLYPYLLAAIYFDWPPARFPSTAKPDGSCIRSSSSGCCPTFARPGHSGRA